MQLAQDFGGGLEMRKKPEKKSRSRQNTPGRVRVVPKDHIQSEDYFDDAQQKAQRRTMRK
jgi:hypothetical protein